jgi:excisionase family DNA binding protein
MSIEHQQPGKQATSQAVSEIPSCLAVEEAAVMLGVALKHVYYLLYMGRLDGWKIRSTWRLFRGSVEAYANERNDIGIIPNLACDHDHQGSGGLSTLLRNNHPAHDLGRPTAGLHGRRRMEHCPPRSFQLSAAPFEPMKNRPERPISTRSGQLEFSF